MDSNDQLAKSENRGMSPMVLWKLLNYPAMCPRVVPWAKTEHHGRAFGSHPRGRGFESH